MNLLKNLFFCYAGCETSFLVKFRQAASADRHAKIKRQFSGRSKKMQVKVYTPRIVEIASEYLPALAKRAADSLGERAGEVSATRGHLVRQAVQDGLLREFDDLIGEDGTVDLVCDPGMEIPLELDNRTLTLTELLEALHYKRSWSDMKAA
jgi:hypothetical protein